MKNTFINPLTQTDAPLHLCACGCESYEKAYACDANKEECYTVYHLAEGEGFVDINHRRHPLSGGELFVVFPRDTVTISVSAPQKVTLLHMSFTGSYALHCLEDAGMDKEQPLGQRQASLFGEAVRECLRYAERYAAPSEMMLNSFVLKALAALEPIVIEASISDRSTDYADMAVQYIQENYQNGINITDVVAHLDIERSYFYRVFTKHMGVSPQQYLLDYRMERARELLLEGASVTETAEAVGIGNIYGFSAIFKKKFGFPPSRLLVDAKESGMVVAPVNVVKEPAPQKALRPTPPKASEPKKVSEPQKAPEPEKAPEPKKAPEPTAPQKPARSLDPWLL